LPVRRRIEQGFGAFARAVVRFRWACLVASILASLALGSQLGALRVDNSDESFLRADDPARVTYDRFKEQYGADDRLMVLFRPEEAFDLVFLESVRSIHRAIEREVPYVEEVTSLVNARNTRGEEDGLVVEELMERWPENEDDLARLRARVFDNPLYVNFLIAENESLVVIWVTPVTYSTLTPELDELEGFGDVAKGEATGVEDLTTQEEAELIAAVRAIVARHEVENADVWVSGGPVINETMSRIMGEDVSGSLTYSFALIVVVLFLLFRRISGALIPPIVVGLSLAGTFGTMALIDLPFSVTLNVLPGLLLTVGICDAVHILAIFYQRLDAGDGTRDDAIVYALEHSGLAVLMTSLTTAAGIGSFITAELAAVSHLGWIAPIGVIYAMVYSLVALPALLSILPIKARRAGGGALERFAVDRVLAGMGRLATNRPRAVLGVTAVTVGVSLLGIAQLQFSHDGLRWFPEDDPVRYSAELVDREFKGTSSLEIVVDTGRENGLHEPALLGRIEDTMRWSETLFVAEHPVHKAISIVDVVKETNRALNGDRDADYVVPDDRALVAQELLLFENSGTDDLEDFTDSLFQTARITVRTPWVDAMVYPDFVDEVKAGLPALLGDDVAWELTGGAMIFSQLFKAVILSMSTSYMIALAVITPLLVLLVGSWKRGLLAMIPNLIPIGFTLAMMGWLDIPLDASTVLIGGVVLGVAVDDTIHFMHKFNRYYEDSGDPAFAIRETLATTGAALLFTSLVLAGGFSMFATCYLLNTAWFGLLAAFAIVVAFLADALVAPALMILATPKRDPQSSIEAAS